MLQVKLAKDKKVREQLEQMEFNALDILDRRGGDLSKLTSALLAILLTWHRVPKVGGFNKNEKLSNGVRIVISMMPPPPYEK